MRNQAFHEEAEACRRQAALFAGKPEAAFLARVASSFEELALQSRPVRPPSGSSDVEASGPAVRDRMDAQ